TGIVRVGTAQELFDVAEILSTQPLLKGPNVVVVTNAGGPGILAADAIEKYGLKMAPISANVRRVLREKLPPAASFNNPIDVLGDATAERYEFALETVLGSEDVASALVILTPQAMTQPEAVANAILEVKKIFPKKIIITAFLGGDLVEEAIKLLEKSKIPNYPFPERAVSSLSAMVRYSDYLNAVMKRRIPRLKADRDKVASIFKRAKRDKRVNLLASEAMAVAEAYGIPTPIMKLATTREEAISITEEIGYPVVLKVESPQILHKTDIGGVKLNLRLREEVSRSFNEILENANRYAPKATLYGVNVQKMVPQGKEMIVGVHRDITFGPLIMFGLGGIYVNFLRDVSFRLAPLTKKDAEDMISETKAYSLLRGIRGEEKSDIKSIVNTILRTSKLVTDFDEINELDVNPLFVYKEGDGCLALDIKITIK
ncbi:MAG: acetate--CoA ligase family protein, partial [Candidatus Bathyarchaeota archaeon]|nr:acetate--CoA ligase family protein [Candidatus Bathyarchaeota archaeon]